MKNEKKRTQAGQKPLASFLILPEFLSADWKRLKSRLVRMVFKHRHALVYLFQVSGRNPTIIAVQRFLDCAVRVDVA